MSPTFNACGRLELLFLLYSVGRYGRVGRSRQSRARCLSKPQPGCHPVWDGIRLPLSGHAARLSRQPSRSSTNSRPPPHPHSHTPTPAHAPTPSPPHPHTCTPAHPHLHPYTSTRGVLYVPLGFLLWCVHSHGSRVHGVQAHGMPFWRHPEGGHMADLFLDLLQCPPTVGGHRSRTPFWSRIWTPFWVRHLCRVRLGSVAAVPCGCSLRTSTRTVRRDDNGVRRRL